MNDVQLVRVAGLKQAMDILYHWRQWIRWENEERGRRT